MVYINVKKKLIIPYIHRACGFYDYYKNSTKYKNAIKRTINLEKVYIPCDVEIRDLKVESWQRHLILFHIHMFYIFSWVALILEIKGKN